MVSCSMTDTKLEQALQQSGSNKEEQEKVLRHFSDHPADSLLLKSTRFLIRNMPGYDELCNPYLSEGKEERIFTYEKERIRFW